MLSSTLISVVVAAVAADVTSLRESGIPFKFVKAGIPLVMLPVKVNGHGPFSFILDTGNASAPFILSAKVASELKLSLTPHKASEHAIPIGLSKERFDAVLESVEIGGIHKVEQAGGVAKAIDELGERLGVRIDGNVGYGFLKDYVVAIDYKAETVSFNSKIMRAKWTAFDLATQAPLITVNVKVNGLPLRFAFDTGAGPCVISPAAAGKLGLEKGAEVPVNASASRKAHVSKAASLEVAGREHKDVTLVVADFLTDISKACGEELDGVVGFGFFGKYKLVIDYPKHRLALM